MASVLQITDIQYYPQIKNFLDPCDHHKGCFLETIRAEMTLQIRTRFELRNYSITNGNTITLDAGDFIAENFSAGDSIFFTFQDGSGNFALNITSVSPTVLIVAGAPLPNGNYGTTQADYLRNLTDLDALRYKFNFIPNSDSVSFISAIDQTVPGYKAEGMRAAGSGVFVPAVWEGEIKGSQTGQFEVAWIQDISDGGENGSGGSPIPGSAAASIQEFKIRHTYTIWPFYLQNELNNIANLERPLRLSGNIDLKHIADFEFRTTLSDPNTSKTGRFDWILGRTNWFGESYDQEPTQYSIQNVVLTDQVETETIDNIKIDTTTRVEFSVISDQGTFALGDPLVCYHAFLPSASAYQASKDSLTDLWQLDSVRQIEGAGSVAGGRITNFTATRISANELSVQYDLIYSASDQAALKSGDNYVIAVQVANDTLSTDESDKTILTIQVGKYTKETAVPGLMSVDKMEFYTEPMTFVDGVSSGFTSANMWIQDGFMVDWRFGLDLSKSAVLKSLTMKLVAFDTVTGESYDVDTVPYDLSVQQIVPVVGSPTDVQAIEIDDIRNFALKEDNQFNYVRLETDNNDGTNQFYKGQTGFKVDWESWLELNIDRRFYDITQDNDGLNRQINRYSGFQDFEIRIFLFAEVAQGDVVTDYEFRSPDLSILDFDEQDGTPINWTRTWRTEDESGADLGGKIMYTEDTKVIATFTPDAPISDPSLYWGMLRIEPTLNPSRASICQISTVQDPKPDNIWKPLPGETKCKLDIVGGVLTLEALIDYTKLDPNKKYNIYARMGLVDQSPVMIPMITKTISIDFDNNRNFVVWQQPGAMSDVTLDDEIFQLADASNDIEYRTSNVNEGGDRSDWSGATLHANFAALKTVLEANSGLFVFMGVNETNYPTIIKEGLLVKFKELGAAVQPSSYTFTQPGQDIDRDFIRWDNLKAEYSVQSFDPNIIYINYALRVVSTTGDEYTEFFGRDLAAIGNAGAGITALNAAIALLASGTKYGVHIHLQTDDNETVPAYGAKPITFDITYNDPAYDDEEVSIQAGFTTVNDQRTWINRTPTAIPGAFSFYNDPYFTVNGKCGFLGRPDIVAPALALNQFFDIQNDNAFTFSAWIETPSGGPSLFNLQLFSNIGDSAGVGAWTQRNGFNLVFFENGATLWFINSDSGNIEMRCQFDYNFAPGTKYLMTWRYVPSISGGFYRCAQSDFFVNGMKVPDRTIVLETIPANGTSRTNGNEFLSGTGAVDKPIIIQGNTQDFPNLYPEFPVTSRTAFTQVNKTKRYTLWDVALTDEEIFQLSKAGDPSPMPQPGNIMHDWDFANPDTASYLIPDLVGGLPMLLIDSDTSTQWTTFVADGAIRDWLDWN